MPNSISASIACYDPTNSRQAELVRAEVLDRLVVKGLGLSLAAVSRENLFNAARGASHFLIQIRLVTASLQGVLQSAVSGSFGADALVLLS